MNKLSGYRQFTLASGETLELKYSNGATEIYAELMGLNSLDEVDKSLALNLDTNPAADGTLTEATKKISPQYLKACRLWIYSAAKYACLVQNKPITFNEWSPSEWMEELGLMPLMGGADQPEEAPKKNEPEPAIVANP